MIHTTYIYLITNIDNNPNKVYIGKSNSPHLRKHYHNSKFGKDITFNIIDIILYKNKKEWEFFENYWIEQFRCWGFELKNKNNGGGGPQFHNEETKQKMRIPKSEETKKKMKKPRVNKQGFSNPKPKKRIPIVQLDKNNNIIQIFASCLEAAQILNLNPIAINNALNHRAQTSGGYLWKYQADLAL
jgi:hypothetical protein